MFYRSQVPQFILEDAWYRGKGCRVICTQPRRISAVSGAGSFHSTAHCPPASPSPPPCQFLAHTASQPTLSSPCCAVPTPAALRCCCAAVAERVAAERGEAVGDNVGYTIRLDSKGGPSSSLMFCTNGVLLRMLTGAGDALAQVTHLVGGRLCVWRVEGRVSLLLQSRCWQSWGRHRLLSLHGCTAQVRCDTPRRTAPRCLSPPPALHTLQVVDEIHERDRFADFLLILVRDLLPAHPHLRVILMSATLHVDLFSGGRAGGRACGWWWWV